MSNHKVMAYFRESAARIDQTMRSDLEAVREPQLAEVLRYIIFNGGKRIRPQLTVLTWRLAGRGQGSGEEALRLAMAFEYLHVASLVHDDVIDHSETRRGKPTAQAAWGLGAAILTGDFLHSRALTLAGQAAGREGVELLGRAITAMVEAEFLQARLATARESSRADYYRVAAGKTGALIGAACEAGILLAGGSASQLSAGRAYGENLGLAFQIADDLLDYLGDPAKTGKAVGNDLVEGKLTLPLLHALEQAEVGDRARLQEILAAEPEVRRECVGEVRELIGRYGGFMVARGKAEELLEAGVLSLAAFPVGPEHELLSGLAAYVLSRDK
ncbi:MAG: polyprenyl synthetase family protein [Desulfobulbaceae bacterium]|nr:polyprenyl synthetase family protein [Desulfobulbaceae bacterium]